MFSVEQEELFQKRFNEGYNLYIDPNYVEWLAINHPEALPYDRPTSNYSDSLIAHFSHVIPETPLEVIDQDSSHGHLTPETPPEVTEQDFSHLTEPLEVAEQDSSHGHLTPEIPPEVTEQGMLNLL